MRGTFGSSPNFSRSRLIICCADLSVQYTLAANSGVVQPVRCSKSITFGSLADFMLAPVVSVGLFLVGEDFAALAAPPQSAGGDQRLTFTAQAVLLACHCAYRFNQVLRSLSLASIVLKNG